MRSTNDIPFQLPTCLRVPGQAISVLKLPGQCVKKLAEVNTLSSCGGVCSHSRAGYNALSEGISLGLHPGARHKESDDRWLLARISFHP